MPLQDDALREVWASDRCAVRTGAQMEGWEGQAKGGRRTDSFATRSGHEESGSPEVQRRPKQVGHPASREADRCPLSAHAGSGV